jgi:hypothetical protein
MKMTAFWHTASKRLVDLQLDRCFRGGYCLYHQVDDCIHFPDNGGHRGVIVIVRRA